MNLTRREALGALAGGVLAGMAAESGIDAAAQPAATVTTSSTSFPVTIEIDAAKPVGKLHPIWRFFGADEPNYAYMKDGRKLLAEIGKLPPPGAKAYFRTHNLLTTGDGTPALKWGSTNAYTEDAAGKPVYDWTIVDRIFDAYLAAGVRPYVQIGFMPKALSRKPEPYQHEWRPGQRYEKIYTGWAHPPNDYDKWGELVFQWARHCVEKYGRAECESWYWQTWNEPNIPYWQGTPEEFHRLHDVAIAAVRRALPAARVGGSDTAGPGGNFQRAFLEHCLRGKNYATGEKGTPIDFVSFHAKGAPSFVDGHVRLGISAQLRNINDGFALVASFPELKDKPIVIGESDPDGCAACQGKQLGYRNGTMYSSYTAATFARKYLLADRHGVNLDGALTWAFEFEDQPFFAGQRVMATNGITLPVFNVFRMMALMGGGQRLAVTSAGEVPLDQVLKDGVRGPRADVSALASTRDGKLFVLAWHYHDDDLPGPEALAELRLANVPGGDGKRRVTHYRVDHEHANAHTVWQRMGAPQAPTPEQYDQLVAAGQLAPVWPADEADVTNGTATLRLPLPRQGVALIVIEPV